MSFKSRTAKISYLLAKAQFKRSLKPKITFSGDWLEMAGFKIGADYELITRFFLKNNIVWKYSGITTTAMLVGGLSSSGSSSYKLITKEIQKALSMNGLKFSSSKIKMRFFWKIVGFLKR